MNVINSKEMGDSFQYLTDKTFKGEYIMYMSRDELLVVVAHFIKVAEDKVESLSYKFKT
jgi:hypothetical protein